VYFTHLNVINDVFCLFSVPKLIYIQAVVLMSNSLWQFQRSS